MLHNIAAGVIQQVQGFVSSTASLVDTNPVVDERTAVKLLQAEWNHTKTDSKLVFNVETPQLEILQGVRHTESLQKFNATG